jgi:hypothetical protein
MLFSYSSRNALVFSSAFTWTTETFRVSYNCFMEDKAQLTTNGLDKPSDLPFGVRSGSSAPFKHFKHLNTTSGSSNSAKPNACGLPDGPVTRLSSCRGPQVWTEHSQHELIVAAEVGPQAQTNLYQTSQDGV